MSFEPRPVALSGPGPAHSLRPERNTPSASVSQQYPLPWRAVSDQGFVVRRGQPHPFVMVPHTVVRQPKLTDKEFRAWVVLDSYADYTSHDCYPSLTTLAKQCGWSVSSAQRAITGLVTNHLLAVESGKAAGKPNVYTLLGEPSVDDKIADLQKAHGPPRVGQGRPRGRSPVTKGGRSPVTNKQDAFELDSLPVAQAPPPKKATTFPLGSFVITEAMKQWLTDNDLGGLNIRRETEQFRDHALANDKRYKDWVAAWRTWMRNAQRFAGNGKQAAGSGIPAGGYKATPWDPATQ